MELSSGEEAHIEVKRLGTGDRTDISDNIYDIDNSINSKFSDIAGDIDTANDEQVADFSISSRSDISTESEFEDAIDELTDQRGSISVDRIRVTVRGTDRSFSIDL